LVLPPSETGTMLSGDLCMCLFVCLGTEGTPMACLVVVCDFLQVEMKTEKRYCANLALRTQTKQENFVTEKK
jgi:hypothetical protein